MKNALRWIICIPAGSIGGFLILIVFKLLGGRLIEPGSIADYLDSLLGGALSGAAAVYIAAYIAPSHKQWVSLVLAMLAALGFVLALPTIIDNRDWAYLLFGIAQDGGTIYIAYKIFRRDITFD